MGRLLCHEALVRVVGVGSRTAVGQVRHETATNLHGELHVQAVVTVHGSTIPHRTHGTASVVSWMRMRVSRAPVATATAHVAGMTATLVLVRSRLPDEFLLGHRLA